MSTTTGSKADGVNITETTSNALGSTGGGEPVFIKETKPIRKRGYHRALKSGKQWALIKKSWSDLLNNFCADFYVPTMQAYVLTKNPLLKLQGLSQWLPEGELKIKVESGTFWGKESTPPSLWSRIKSWFRR